MHIPCRCTFGVTKVGGSRTCVTYPFFWSLIIFIFFHTFYDHVSLARQARAEAAVRCLLQGTSCQNAAMFGVQTLHATYMCTRCVCFAMYMGIS